MSEFALEFDEFGETDELIVEATEATFDWTVVEDISVLELVIGELEEMEDPVGDDLLITMSIRSSLG